ncbi:MAG: hypothetical protein ACI8SE_000925 [Bacteroidia bacterium]|jgi:hypothetical protein
MMNSVTKYLCGLTCIISLLIGCKGDNCDDVFCSPWFFEQPDVTLIQFDTATNGFKKTQVDSMWLVTKYEIFSTIDSSMMFEDNNNDFGTNVCLNKWNELKLCKIDPYGPNVPADSTFEGWVIIDSTRGISISIARYLVTPYKLREGACCGPPPTFELTSIDIDGKTYMTSELPILIHP